MLTRAKAFLLLTTFVLPFAVNAAGLGKLSVTSGPGQPFKAEIDLIAVKKEEKSTLSARLASQEIFRQANVDYLPLLSTFKATVENRSDGLPYVKIVSSQPIAEPLLNILIELNWSSGRLLREYTVVLDQADHVAHPAKSVVQAQSPVSGKAEPAAEKVHASGASTRHDEKTSAESSSPGGKTHTIYGPVKQGETLGGIAKDIALPTGTSFNQMLVALHRANPDAFIDGNMHQLMAGPVLKIPGSNEIAAIGSAEANKEVQMQTADWNRRRFPPVTEVPEELKQTVTGKIDRTADADSVAAREPAKEILKLSKGAEPWNDDKDASNMGAGPVPISGEKQPEQSAAQDRLQAMEEDVAAKSRALREANERIALLEKNIRELQQLLELKNAAMADMQKRAEAGQPGPAAVSIPSAAVSPHPESNLEAGMMAQASAPPAAELSSPGTETDGTELPAADPENSVNTDEPVEIATPVQLAKPFLEPPLGTDAGARANAKGTSTIIDDLVANFEYLGGALVLLITGIVGVSMVRAPKSQLLFDSDEDNIPTAALQSRHNVQEASLSPGENPRMPAHEMEPVPFTEAGAAAIGSIGTGLSMSDAQSSETIKDESAERSSRWHEIINKIDLARAYQEMDDKDAARQILQEVIREGDVRQQESARLMLSNL